MTESSSRERTDRRTENGLFDATDLAVCRMYGMPVRSGTAWPRMPVKPGIARAHRADDGVPLGGSGTSSGPVELVSHPSRFSAGWVLALAALGVAAAYYPRLAAVGRFRQSLLGAFLHPMGVLVCWRSSGMP